MTRRKGTPAQEHAPLALTEAAIEELQAEGVPISQEMIDRSTSAPAGMRGRVLRTFIETGLSGPEQTRLAQAERIKKEALMATETKSRKRQAGGKTTVLDAAVAILRRSKNPLPAKEIAKRVVARKDVRLNNKAPEVYVTAKIYVAAKEGDPRIRKTKEGFVAIPAAEVKAPKA